MTNDKKSQLPAHLLELIKKIEDKQAADSATFGVTITDVTPEGFGPTNE